MKTYFSSQRIIMGDIEFRPMGSDFQYTAKSEEEEKAVESSYFFQRGIVVAEETPKKPVNVVEVEEPVEEPEAMADRTPDTDPSLLEVTNVKQALEWLVQNKGEKRGIYSRAKVLEMAKKHGVEFPNLKKL